MGTVGEARAEAKGSSPPSPEDPAEQRWLPPACAPASLPTAHSPARLLVSPTLLAPPGPSHLPLQEETPRNDQNNTEAADGLSGFHQGRLIGPKRKSTLKRQDRREKKDGIWMNGQERENTRA